MVTYAHQTLSFEKLLIFVLIYVSQMFCRIRGCSPLAITPDNAVIGFTEQYKIGSNKEFSGTLVYTFLIRLQEKPKALKMLILMSTHCRQINLGRLKPSMWQHPQESLKEVVFESIKKHSLSVFGRIYLRTRPLSFYNRSAYWKS